MANVTSTRYQYRMCYNALRSSLLIQHNGAILSKYPPYVNSKLISLQRQSIVDEIVEERGTLSVDDLVTALKVPSMTVWRDLITLENMEIEVHIVPPK